MTDEPEGPSAPTIVPIAAPGRIALIDVLRGFAVAGILLVNVHLFFAPIYLTVSDVQWWTAPIDRFAASAVVFFAQAKFYPLFSFLFGVGVALQLERATAKGLSADRFLTRRLLGLTAIGLVHAFLIWFGDILVTYAIAGFLLLVLRRLPDRALAIVGVVLMLLPLVGFTAIVVLFELAKLAGEAAGPMQEMIDEQTAANLVALDSAVEAYRTGGFREVAAARAGQVMVVWGSWIFSIPNVLGLFALGCVAGRRGWLAHPDVARIRRWLPWLAIVGVAASALQTWALRHDHPGSLSFTTWLGQVGTSIGGPTLCLTYVGILVLAFRTERGRQLLEPLAAVGRMALTNYLTHSLVFTTLALPWGFGLYGRVRPSVGVAAALTVYLLQIPLSMAWLARFRFGPCEWLWRSMTYGRPQPLRQR